MAKRKGQTASRQRPARELPSVGTELMGRYHGQLGQRGRFWRIVEPQRAEPA